MTRQRCTLLCSLMLVMFSAASQAADPDARAAQIEAQMTDAERWQLLHGIMPFAIPGKEFDLQPYQGVPAVAGFVRGIARLGVPDLVETDASLGIANPLQLRPDLATALPSGLAIASTFNPKLAYAGGALVGAEARSFGYNVLLGGGVNLARDPRNGRNFEYLGEDPLLAGVMGGEAIRGTQSQGVISTVKHFSLNAQETLRHTVDAQIDEAAHRESDLLAFQIAIERGQPGAVMCAYNLVNGAYACGSDHLQNEVLKRDWRYKGWVMSDWGAVHNVSYFNAGLDQQSGAQLDDQIWFDEPLRSEYAAGRVSKARVSDAVRRILRSIYAVGAERSGARSPIDFQAHGETARQVAGEGIVVLRNEGALPIRAPKSVVVIGGHADIGVMSGAGSSQVIPVGGPAAVIPVGGSDFFAAAFGRQVLVPSSPLNALRSALPKDTLLVYESGYSPEAAAARARQTELAIVFATQWQIEGFDAGMTLPEGQDALIAAVAQANPNTIVVLETGNPVKMPWLSSVKAVVQAWYPGQKGGEAIAQVLTGVVNPSGRLPMSWPNDERQNPRPVLPGLGLPEGTRNEIAYTEGSNVGYRWFAAHGQKPLFPFGHGLSYTRFEYQNLSVDAGPSVTARVTVRNVGNREGADVPQIYLMSVAERPVQRLVGFQKVQLKPGESKEVLIRTDSRLLARWDTSANGWRIDGGDYDFALGASAGDLRKRMTLKLASRRFGP